VMTSLHMNVSLLSEADGRGSCNYAIGSAQMRTMQIGGAFCQYFDKVLDKELDKETDEFVLEP